MRRVAVGVGAVALVTMVAGPMTSAAAPAGSREDCTWHRHSKRVVKKVKRHGKVRRVTRVKRWWTCDRQTAKPGAGEGPGSVPGGGGGGEEPAPTVSRLSVKAVEWGYTLSRPDLPAGEAIVELNNQGEDNHNLKLQRQGSGDAPFSVPEASPLKRTSARLTLAPGSYRLYCSLFQHEEKGMVATLTVAGG